MMLPSQNRPLNEKERSYLRSQRAALMRQREALLRRMLWMYVIVFGALAGLTALDVKKHVIMIFACWGVGGALICVWAYVPERRKLSRRIVEYDSVVATGICAERQIKANRMWEFEEQENEGVCYAFELQSGGVAIVAGQDFYAAARFPNSDFSIIEFYSQEGNLNDFLIEKRGTKMIAERVIPGREKKGLDIPQSGAFLDGTLEQAYASLSTA
jgi:hypothetical protein